MAAVLLVIAVTNLLVCAVVMLPLVWGTLRLRNLATVDSSGRNEWPLVSVIVAARNEERDVRRGVESLTRLDYPQYEIIAVNDRSTDRTGEIIDQVAQACPLVRACHLQELPAGWLGKNHALAVGAAAARGEILLFTDADIVMEPSVLRRAVHYLLERQIDHLPLIFRVQMPNWLMEGFVAAFWVYFFSHFRPWDAPNPRSSAHIGVGGFNMVRRDAYQQMGTHEAIRMRPDDDVKLGKLVKLAGLKQEAVVGVDLVWVPWYASLGELVRGMEKNAFSGVDYRVGMIVLTVVAIVLFNIFPFVAVWFAAGWTRWLFVANVALLWTLACWAAYRSRLHVLSGLTFPLAAGLFAFILTRTTILNLAQGGIRWRDTYYSLAELKANKV